MMLVKLVGRGQRGLTGLGPILFSPLQLLVLKSRLAKFDPKVFILRHQPLHLPDSISSALTAPTFAGKCDRNKKAGDKKADCKSKNKRNNPLKKSGVTHILHLLRTSRQLLR